MFARQCFEALKGHTHEVTLLLSDWSTGDGRHQSAVKNPNMLDTGRQLPSDGDRTAITRRF